MTRRRVGVNLLWLVPGVVGGSEEYTTRTLVGLDRLAPDDLDITLFTLRPFADAHPELVDGDHPATGTELPEKRRPRVRPCRVAVDTHHYCVRRPVKRRTRVEDVPLVCRAVMARDFEHPRPRWIEIPRLEVGCGGLIRNPGPSAHQTISV